MHEQRSETYNGWTNYETWAVGMFLDGNYTGEGTYRDILDLTREHGAYLPDVADAIESYVREDTAVDDRGRGENGLATDLLGAALSSVNWRELAEHKCADIIEEWEREAREIGSGDAISAATWIVDGNTDVAQARKVLTMMRNGDPQASDYFPRQPDLSGEWSDDRTPASLAEEITMMDGLSDEIVDALAAAYETGVSDAFGSACEQELAAFAEVQS